MNAPILKALILDAFHQVVDNSVFRILAVLTLLPILLTFVVGFQEEGIVFLFGLKSWSYESLIQFATGGTPTNLPTAEIREQIIEAVLGLIFTVFAGSFGVLFCISATAFFVPRMIEKGAADVLFHKPVSRLGLYLSRYVAGLIFVGFLAGILVVGMYLGFLLVSGHNDPGILFAALALTYLFGLIHGLAMLIGVVTRSTVASILLAILFFFVNGCIHQIWATKEMSAARQEVQDQEVEVEPEDDAVIAEEEEEEEEEEQSLLVRFFVALLDTAHYTLPKTTDADVIAKKLRKAATGPIFEDERSSFYVQRLPRGFEADDPETSFLPTRSTVHDELLGERFLNASSDDGGVIEVWRRDKRMLERTRGSRTIQQIEFGRDAVAALKEVLETDWAIGELDDTDLPRSRGDEETDLPVVRHSTEHLSFLLAVDGEMRRVHVVIIPTGSVIYTLVQVLPDDDLAPFRTFIGETGFITQDTTWYEDTMKWGGEPKFNLWVSIASSLGFLAVMLLLGWWRLTRIDF